MHDLIFLVVFKEGKYKSGSCVQNRDRFPWKAQRSEGTPSPIPLCRNGIPTPYLTCISFSARCFASVHGAFGLYPDNFTEILAESYYLEPSTDTKKNRDRDRGNTDGMVPMVILKSILEKISGGGQDSQVLLYENSIHYFYSCTSNEGFSHVQNYVKRRFFKLRWLRFGRFLSVSLEEGFCLEQQFTYDLNLDIKYSQNTKTDILLSRLNFSRPFSLSYPWYFTTSWPFKACDSRYHRVHL